MIPKFILESSFTLVGQKNFANRFRDMRPHVDQGEEYEARQGPNQERAYVPSSSLNYIFKIRGSCCRVLSRDIR